MEVRSGYLQTDIGAIPEDWGTDTLLGVCRQIMDYRGRTPRKLGMEWGGGDIPALSAGNVKRGFVDFEEECYFGSEDLYRRWMTQGDVAKDDILFTTEAPLGNVALVPDTRRYILSQRTVLLQVDPDRISGHFLFQVLQSVGFRRMLADYSSGSTAKGIQRRKLEQLAVPLPSLPEQEAIAAALSDMDRLLGGLEREIAKKRDLRQAAMQELLTGQTRLPTFRGQWKVKRLGDIAESDPENLGTSTPPDYRFNYVSLEDVDHGVRRGHSEQVFRSAPSRARRRLRENDVLVATVRPNLQSHLLFRGQIGEWVCSTGFCVMRCHVGVAHPDYVFAHLFTASVGRQIDTLLTGSSYPAINSADVRALQISLPPYEEQVAIAAVLSDMDAEVSALEARRHKTRDLKEAMMQELLTGKTRLVPFGGAHA